jgi:hypothetical protein
MSSSPAVLLYGNDDFAIQRRLEELSAIFPDASSAGMNTARLDARSMSEDDLNNAVNAMPFLADRRLIVLANPSARYLTPQARLKFQDFLRRCPDHTAAHHRARRPEQCRTQADAKDENKHWLVKWMKKAVCSLIFMLPGARNDGLIIKPSSRLGRSGLARPG